MVMTIGLQSGRQVRHLHDAMNVACFHRSQKPVVAAPTKRSASPARGDKSVRRARVCEGGDMSELEVSTDPARLDMDCIYDFLQTSYWAHGRQRSVIERAIRHSLCFGAYLDQRQVGFARVVSDRAVFAYLMDVFVLPDFRGRGISKTMMRAVLQHPDLQNLRVFLLATRDAHGLYEQFGFRPLAEPDRWMAIQDAASDERAV
jgi:GNAT superfamily N-acetyltransferase